MKTIILIIVLSISYPFNINAQQAVVATGNEASGVGGKASFSIGQVFYNVFSGSNGYKVQGIQQPFEISVISSSPDTETIKLTTSVFPVPANEFVTLKINNAELEKMSYLLVDLSGRILLNSSIKSSVTLIPMAEFADGTYLLRVMKSKKLNKTFKIIKK